MQNKLTGWDDTIVALSTPPGVGAIGVVRLSGNKSFEIVNDLFTAKNLSEEKTHTLHVGFLHDGERVIDEVVVALFRGPHSYTGEDVIEISCHGSPYIHQQVIEACIERGARLAKAGEFTQRAFLSGRLDLTQAEAVADLIVSNTEASRRTALNNIRGGFSRTLKDLREQLIQFSALIELELDFAGEDVEFADRRALKLLVRRAQEQVDLLVRSFKLGNVIRNGVSVAIIGKPNAGKSTLLNALLNEDRAIVSDIPGTTRDTIEELINIDGILFRLIDTAGIRSHSADEIEKAGIQRSMDKMQSADVVIYLFDANEMQPAELNEKIKDLKDFNFLLVGNKVDLADESEVRNKFSTIAGIIFISAKSGSHIEVLKERMLDLVMQENVQSENVIVTNARHYHALKEVQTALKDVYTGMDEFVPGDLLSLDIRRCLHFLGEITGEITNEDQLDYIFSKFCIGK